MEAINYKWGVPADAEIIQKILAGEVALFEVLIRRYNPLLYKIARSHGFNHQDAEDLMQEAYCTAYFQLSHLEQPSSFKSWISKILIHKCLYKLNYGYSKNEQPDTDKLYKDPYLITSHATHTNTE